MKKLSKAMIERLQNSYYKIWIVSLFTFIAAALILFASILSYSLVRDIYLSEKAEQVGTKSKIIAAQIDGSFLELLALGKPTETVENYFLNIFGRNLPAEDFPEVFIFDKNFNVLIHHDSSRIEKFQPHLFLNKEELAALKPAESLATIPFKAEDGNWYLWGFARLNDELFLAYREDARQISEVESLSKIFWAAGLAGILIALLVGWFLSKTLLTPLNKLSYFSGEIGKGKFNAESPQGLKGEIKILAGSMERMKNELKSNQEEKERMLAQIAHEIRNPLGGIELLASLTKEDLREKELDDSYLDKILKEVENLKKIINVYLEYSKPHPPEEKICSLSEIKDELEMLFSDEFKSKQIKFIDDLKNEKILFDPGHLRQVLLNLIKNSIAAIEDEGEIKLSSFENKNEIFISLKDNGKGIAEEIRLRLFEPFYTTKAEGTGLGLATSRKLCEENGAELLLKNDFKEGTLFIIKKKMNGKDL